MRCDVNPDVGNDRSPDATRLGEELSVLVAGAGPAGMETALRLAARGASVTLIERDGELGGQLRYASQISFKSDLADYLRYLQRMVTRSPVNVVVGREVTLDTVQEFGPDVVIVATGATPNTPTHDSGELRCVQALELLAGAPVEARVAVIGAGATGCEVAAFLCQQGHGVTLLEQEGEIGKGMTPDELE